MESRLETRQKKITMFKRASRSKERLRISKGDFLALYHQHAEKVYRYIYARVGSQQEAEDITSQVFLDALNGLHRLDNKKNFSPWIYTIARNKVVDSYRGSTKTVSLDGLPEFPGESKDMLTGLIQGETKEQLAEVLSNLGPEQLELLRLRYAGELTYRQIGEVVGKSEAAVKMAATRLVSKLRAEMEQSNE
jgi:RNA polymerase sigma-70 factor (ECF subfamily)